MRLFGDLEAFGDRTAVINTDGQAISYQRLANVADQLVANLNDGDLVAIQCDNSLASLSAYIGCIRKGIPAVLVDANLDESFADGLNRDYQISAKFLPRSEHWERLRDTGPPVSQELALLLSTSGSTGSPKLVRLSNQNLGSNAKSIAEYLRISKTSRAITSLSQHYSFGLSVINSHLMAGGSLALTSASMTERRFWDFFELSQPDSLSGVPAMFELLRKLRIERMELPSLRTLAQAGGHLQDDSVRWFAELAEKRKWEFFVMYGQTEASPRMSYLPTELAKTFPSSIGRPIPGGRFELVDEDLQPINTPNKVGQIVYYGDNVMLGYAESVADLALSDEMSGRLETGDLAEFDQHQLFYVRGRLKRFVKVFGNRVNLDELEQLLIRDGINVAVCGHDDKIVVVSSDREANESAAMILKNKLKIHHSAIDTLVIQELPRTSAGKIRYRELLDAYNAVGN